MSALPPLTIPKRELRDRFNQGGYWERAQRGELIEVVIDDNHPASPLAEEPFCTQSQLIEYQTPSGLAVAIVHQYLRPDGTLGLTGLPDPKMVRDRGRIYLPDAP